MRLRFSTLGWNVLFICSTHKFVRQKFKGANCIVFILMIQTFFQLVLSEGWSFIIYKELKIFCNSNN